MLPVDLFSLVASDTRLRRVGGGWYAGACPFCGGRDRFVLKRTADGWRWYCRRCGDGKYHDAVDYIKRRDNVSHKEAVERLGGIFPHFSALKKPPQPQAEPQQDSATIRKLNKLAQEASAELERGESTLAAQVKAYLEQRGIIEPTARRALLGAAIVFDPQAGCKRPAAVIPHFDKELSVHAIKYRFVDDVEGGLRYIGAKGSRFSFYGLPEHLGYYDRLLVVEGELNLLSLAQVLPELDLLSTGSQSVSEAQQAALAELVRRYREVYVWMDDGRKAAELTRRMGGKPLKSPTRDGVKVDANALLQRDLLHEFLTRLTGAACYGWTLAGWRDAHKPTQPTQPTQAG